MRRARELVGAVLLLVCAVMQSGCSSGFTAEGGSSASDTSKKYWDRCLGAQCPPMNADDDAPKRKQN